MALELQEIQEPATERVNAAQTENMKKLSVKVIKRKTTETMAATGNLTVYDLLPIPFINEKVIVQLLQRNINSTISSWIRERQENARIEKNAAIRGMVDGEILAGAA